MKIACVVEESARDSTIDLGAQKDMLPRLKRRDRPDSSRREPDLQLRLERKDRPDWNR